MAKYYYNKYVADESYSYSNPDANWTYVGEFEGQSGGRPNYSFTAGSVGWATSGTYDNVVGIHRYTKSGDTTMSDIYNLVTDTFFLSRKSCTQTTNYSQGTLIQENIIAEDGTYPDDGQQDGFYWVQQGLVPTTNSGFLALLF